MRTTVVVVVPVRCREDVPGNIRWIDATFGTAFAIFTVTASFGIGNMFQANNLAVSSHVLLGRSGEASLLYNGIVGVVAAILVASVILGGIRKIAHVTAAALVSENKVLAHPASVDTIPTSAGKEDHVSMGAHGARQAAQIIDHVSTVLAIEWMCAAQALDYRAPLSPGVGPRLAHAEIRKEIAQRESDRPFGDDMTASRELLRSQRIARAVELKIGPLA